MIRFLVVLSAVLLAGCETPTGKPQPPAGWLMQKSCKLPPVPADDGDPVARADYDTQMRRCAADRGDQVRGLQSYARKVSRAAK